MTSRPEMQHDPASNGDDWPSHRYYQRMVGRWRGKVAFTLTDPAALERVASSFHRMMWRSSASSGRLGGPWMETTMVDGAEVVVHATTLRLLGLPLFWGEERFHLASDGRSFRVEGAHRTLVAPWKRLSITGEGEVLPNAEGARYTFQLLGTELVQTTRIDGDALVATQTTPFSRSEVRLWRVPPSS